MKPILRLTADRIRKEYLRLQNAAIDRGLIRGQRDYTRFVIVCRSRVGSNMLSSYLNSHANAVVKAEEFSFYRIKESDGLASRDPAQHLAREVFCAYPASVKAVGFKLFYTHGRRVDPGQPTVWELLRNDPELKVIHLVRNNILRSHLSEAIAFKTEKWTQSGRINSIPSDSKTVTLDADKCRKAFEKTEQGREEADQCFAAHERLDICYEDLASKPQATLRRVLPFLNLPPRRLGSYHSKQNPEPLSHLIENYAELEKQFSGTPWQRFFED
ncbi:MAG: sulfotransferase [Pseudomonadota bacterium]